MTPGRWIESLTVNPIPTLLAREDAALTCFVRHDLLDEVALPVERLADLPDAQRLAGKQLPSGAWHYPGKSYDPVSNTNYDLLETYRNLRLLVEMYGFNRRHPVIQKAAEYLFSFQTSEGDIRGILGNQYMPYYHGVILELLIKSGYQEDGHVEKGLQWLLAMRQQDGGWIIPAQLIPAPQKNSQLWHGPPIPPDRSRPHAHIATGMILRAFAAHPAYCRLPEAANAAERLKERLFQADRYNDRRSAAYWLKFQFPFWWPNLVTALDTLSRLGFDRQDAQIARGLAWLKANQAPDGLWDTGYGFGKKAEGMRGWVGLAVCRILKQFYE